MDITDSCLDAETLAAWVDGGLTAPDLERVQTHVADCVRCQAMVGTLVKITSAAPAAKSEAAPRRWLGWLVPLTAAAAAVTIWVAIPGSKLDTRVPTTQTPPAPAARREAPEAPAGKVQPSLPQPVPAQQAAAAPALIPERAQEARRDEPAPGSALDKLSSAAESAPPAAPPVQAPADSATANAVGAARPAVRGALTRSTVDIVSPDPMIRWRLAGNGVERSINGGGAWETTQTGVNTPLTAGAAPSTTAVWVVGDAGVVLLSIDGRTWRRLQFPEMTNLSVVRARDARSAAVTTADGRIFSTTDAGVTWNPGP